jgi:ferredoxin-type protein NapH
MMRRVSTPQVARRALQLSVLAFIVYTAMSGPWRNFKLAHNHRRLVTLMEGEFWGTLYGLNEDVLSWLGEPYRVSLDFLGMPWAGRVFGLDTADPMIVAGQLVGTGAAPLGLWLSLIIPLGLAAVLGKVFCSHLCPMRFAFEVGEWVRVGLTRLGVPLLEWRSEDRFGGWVLAGGLLATVVAGPAIWLFVLPYVSLAASVFLAITTGALSVLAAVVLFWFVVEVALAPGYFCKNLCPTGFLLEQVGRVAPLRVRKDEAEPCPTSCNVCQTSCPYELRPKENLPMSACDRCGRCVSACPSDKLSRGLLQIAATVAVVVLASAGAAPPATAHHNKGLPHYGYFENYPQLPVEEYVVIDGPWEMGAVVFNFQGLDRRTADTPNDVKIYLYLYDDRTGSAYEGPLTVEIRNGGEVVATFERVQVDEEAVYSTRETLPRSGDYEIVARVGEETVSLEFHVDLSSDRLPVAWITGVGGSAALLTALTLVGRRRRYRRARGRK